ncbi:hypothetical protein MTR_1g033640 [Medicago truncatula]|uniref:Uncharacterized protein n=1 Tax=Medicago truncatula TaxID=3880 RepID=A0A072VF99_MEDTR|nr:hypothetical protein MTR_1g033640 [Medicago truncatula]
MSLAHFISDNVQYVQGSEFKPQTPHLFIFKVFVRFRLSDQLRSSADKKNDFGVVNVANPETWVFRRLKYSHMCRL